MQLHGGAVNIIFKIDKFTFTIISALTDYSIAEQRNEMSFEIGGGPATTETTSEYTMYLGALQKKKRSE